MNFWNCIGLKLLMPLTIAGLAACSSTPKYTDLPPTASPTEEFARLEADVISAREAQVDVLAAKQFNNANTALNDAREKLAAQKSSKDTLREIAIGRAWLEEAQRIAQISQNNMEEVIRARQRAIAANAPAVLPKEFSKADAELEDVSEDLEKSDFSSATKNRGKLQAMYLDLELRAIRENNLSAARDLVTKSRDEGAAKLAPRSLAVAEKRFQDADAYIIGNRHDQDGIRSRSDAAYGAAEHLLRITREAKAGRKMPPEEIALRLESERNQVQAKQNQLSELQNALQSTQQGTSELSAENKRLAKEREMNEKFEAARAQFSAEEAEVYRQGDRLIIRLRRLEFPYAKATLPGSSYSLLGKVQKVINSFGESNVVVEGHTDSTGGREANLRLSNERAQAVKEFLEANPGPNPLEISVTGYGYQKPLASNKSAAGRAQNRRVDIVIEPKKASDKL